MSLPHAILTALLEKPSSGLELTRRFDKSIGFFWSATHQQIYRELNRLERDGLIQALPQPPSRGQRKEYAVLPAGRAELARWVGENQDPKPIRDPLLLRLRAATVVGSGGLAAELRRHLALHRQQLALYQQIEEHDLPAEQEAGENRLQHLILRAGLTLESFWVEWLTRTLADIPDDGAPETADEAPSGGPPDAGA